MPNYDLFGLTDKIFGKKFDKFSSHFVDKWLGWELE